MQNSKLTVREMCIIAIFTALTAIMAQISIHMPLGVPMTMQTFAITLVAVMLGARNGALSILVYLLLGAVGLPVFASMSGGIGTFFRPTGGFLISFPIMAYIIGCGAKYYKSNKALFITFLVLGTASNYVIGVLVFCLMTKSSLAVGITACVLPFIPTAIVKAVLAVLLGNTLKERVKGLVPC